MDLELLQGAIPGAGLALFDPPQSGLRARQMVIRPDANPVEGHSQASLKCLLALCRIQIEVRDPDLFGRLLCS
jgi:hypothetical protein